MKSKVIIMAVLLGLATSSYAKAADLEQPFILPEARPANDGGWTFAASPYFWGAGISGDVGQFGLPSVHIQSDFSDVLKDLDFAYMAVGEARNDRFSIFADVIYTETSAGAYTPFGIAANQLDVTTKTFVGTLGVGYAVFEEGRSTIDVVAGARVWHASTEISFSGGLLGGTSVSDGATWVDAIAGFRGRYFLTNNFYVSAWGLIGTGQANLDWDVAAGIGYEFNEKISAVAGYRTLGVDYSHDGFEFNVVQQGPILGLVVRF